jgi:hypothetical protein
MTLDLDTLEALYAAATPGKWSVDALRVMRGTTLVCTLPLNYRSQSPADSAAIAALHNAFPALLAAARERATLTARVAELELHVGSLHKAAAAGRDAERARVLALVRFNRNPACPSCGLHLDADDLIADIERGEHREGEGL